MRPYRKYGTYIPIILYMRVETTIGTISWTITSYTYYRSENRISTTKLVGTNVIIISEWILYIRFCLVVC